MRTTFAMILVPFMKVTGYRFSKDHRMYNTLTYRMIDTIKANIKAGL